MKRKKKASEEVELDGIQLMTYSAIKQEMSAHANREK